MINRAESECQREWDSAHCADRLSIALIIFGFGNGLIFVLLFLYRAGQLFQFVKFRRTLGQGLLHQFVNPAQGLFVLFFTFYRRRFHSCCFLASILSFALCFRKTTPLHQTKLSDHCPSRHCNLLLAPHPALFRALS